MERKPDEDEGQGGWLYKLWEMVAGYLSVAPFTNMV